MNALTIHLTPLMAGFLCFVLSVLALMARHAVAARARRAGHRDGYATGYLDGRRSERQQHADGILLITEAQQANLRAMVRTQHSLRMVRLMLNQGVDVHLDIDARGHVVDFHAAKKTQAHLLN